MKQDPAELARRRATERMKRALVALNQARTDEEHERAMRMGKDALAAAQEWWNVK